MKNKKQHQWCLKCYSFQNRIQDEIKKINEKMEYLLSQIDRPLTKEHLLNILRYQDDLYKIIFSIDVFVEANYYTDIKNAKIEQEYYEYQNLMDNFTKMEINIEKYILKNNYRFFLNCLQDANFEKYKRFLTKIMVKKINIEENQNKCDYNEYGVMGNMENIRLIICETEISFDRVKNSCGKSYNFDMTKFNKFIGSADSALRRNSYISALTGYKKRINTFKLLYEQFLKEEYFTAKKEMYKNVCNRLEIEEEENFKIFKLLIKQVRRHSYVLQNICNIFKKNMNSEIITYYDLNYSKLKKENITIDDAKKHICKSLEVLGDEYYCKLKQKLDSNLIDYFPRKNKISGAYTTSVNGFPSIIFMNYLNDIDSLYVFIHEMGHALHYDFTNEKQNIRDSNINMIIAEIVSSVNEILLFKYLVKQKYLDSNSVKIDFLNKIRQRIFRQTICSEFEYFAHTLIEEKGHFSTEELNKKYLALNKKYYGKNVIIDKDVMYEWALFPHIYSSYYVYKYALGMIVAINIIEKIDNDSEFYKKYIDMLEKGDSVSPYKLISNLGIDLEDIATYENAFKFINNVIESI